MDAQLINSLWNNISEEGAEALRMSEKEAMAFNANKVARLIGLLPFIAACDDAHRTALAHLAVFVIANRAQARRVFDHAPTDDAEPLARLRTIAYFKGGNPATLERGMALLGLCMVSGYRRDAELDGLMGTYNPHSTLSTFTPKAVGEFKRILGNTETSELDSVFTEEEAIVTYWKD